VIDISVLVGSRRKLEILFTVSNRVYANTKHWARTRYEL